MRGLGHVKYLKGKRKTRRDLFGMCEGKRMFEDLGLEGRIISKPILQETGWPSTQLQVQ